MATALLPKRLLNYKDKEIKNLSADKIWVNFLMNEYDSKTKEVKPNVKHTKKLSELYVKVKRGGKPFARPVSSYEEFVREWGNGNLYAEVTMDMGIAPKGKKPSDTQVEISEPYYESFEVPDSYESTDNLTITKFIGETVNVETTEIPFGMSRTRKVQEDEVSGDDTFLLVKFVGSSKQEFVKKSDIFYIEGASTNWIYNNGKSIKFKSLEGKNLQVGNRVIETLYTEKEYSFGEYQKFETLNAKDLQRESYEIIKDFKPDEIEKQIKAGKIKKEDVKELDGVHYIKTSVTKDDKYYTEQTHKVLTVPDPKKPGKTKEEAYYAVKVYEVNGNGNYIQLKVKGGNKVEMIDVSTLCDEAGNPIKKSDIKNYVGKTIKIKTESGIVLETENLTFEQANYLYTKHYNYEPSVSKEDFMADNSYLQTKTGEFVEETKVRPIGFKFIDNDKKDKAEAFLIKIETAEGVLDKIVKAEDYEQVSKKYKVTEAYGLKGCAFDESHVVQNTTNAKNGKGKIEECTVLKNYNAEKNIYEDLKEEDLKSLKETLFQKFQEAYANGQYNIDHVYVDGKRIELDERLKRFILTDEHLMKDYAADTLRYTGLGKSSIKYVSKDGKLGKFEGNTKLKFGKTVKKAYGIWAKSLVYYLGFSLTWAGMLAALAAPAVMAAAGVAIIAAPVLIPIVTGVACWFANLTRRPFKDKTKFNRKKWGKDVEKELAAINENMKDTDMSLGYSKDAFLAKMARIKSDILASSKSTIGSGFKVLDGEIVVDSENVNDVMKFRKVHKKDLKNLKKNKSEVERAKKKYEKLYKPFKAQEEKGIISNPDNKKYKKALEAKQTWLDLQSEYENQENHFNKKMACFNSEVNPTKKEKDVDSKLKRAERLQNFWMVKKFASKEELGFENEDEFKKFKEELKSLSYDPAKDVFITKDGEYVADTVKPKVQLSTEMVIIPEAQKETVDLLTKLKNLMDKQNKPKEVERPIVEEEEKDKEIAKEIPPVKEDPKPKKKRVNKHVINSEGAVVRELEDKNPTYDYVLKLLTKKSSKFALSKEDAEKAIYNLCEKVGEIHANGMAAKDVLKDSPVDIYILAAATKKMFKGETLQR